MSTYIKKLSAMARANSWRYNDKTELKGVWVCSISPYLKGFCERFYEGPQMAWQLTQRKWEKIRLYYSSWWSEFNSTMGLKTSFTFLSKHLLMMPRERELRLISPMQHLFTQKHYFFSFASEKVSRVLSIYISKMEVNPMNTSTMQAFASSLI